MKLNLLYVFIGLLCVHLLSVKQKEPGDPDIGTADMKPKLKKKKKKLLMKGGPLTSGVTISDSSGGASNNTNAATTPGVPPNTDTPTSAAEDRGERGSKLKERKPNTKKERKTKEEQVMVDDSDDNDEEDCSAHKCLRPTGNYLVISVAYPGNTFTLLINVSSSLFPFRGGHVTPVSDFRM